MAYTLSFVVDASDVNRLSVVVDASDVQRLSVVTAESKFPGLNLSDPYLTEALPESYTIAPDGGGAAVGGRPTIEFYLDGAFSGNGIAYPVTVSGGTLVSGAAVVSVVKVAHHVITPTGGVIVSGAARLPTIYDEPVAGGVAVSGSAVVVAKLLEFFTETASGGVVVSGTAPATYSWTKYIPTSGVTVGGEAGVIAHLAVVGTVTAAVPAITATGTGTSLYKLVEVNLGVVTADITGDIPDITSISTALPSVQMDAVATIGLLSSIDATLPIPDATAVGGTYGLNVDLPLITASATALIGVRGSVTAAIPAIAAVLLPVGAISATMPVVLPQVAAALNAVQARVATVSASLRVPTPSINAQLASVATLNGALTLIDTQLSALMSVSATVLVVLQSVDVSLTARIPVGDVINYTATTLGTPIPYTQRSQTPTLVQVTNTLSNAVSTYEQYNFNSFAEIGGKLYGANHDGLFELTGELDDTAEINSTLKSAAVHFGSEMQKRMSDFFMAARADGDITLRVFIDENDPLEYTLSPLDIASLKQRRSLIGKGAKGKNWQFELSNVGGCDFDIDTINLAAVNLSRRL